MRTAELGGSPQCRLREPPTHLAVEPQRCPVLCTALRTLCVPAAFLAFRALLRVAVFLTAFRTDFLTATMIYLFRRFVVKPGLNPPLVCFARF